VDFFGIPVGFQIDENIRSFPLKKLSNRKNNPKYLPLLFRNRSREGNSSIISLISKSQSLNIQSRFFNDSQSHYPPNNFLHKEQPFTNKFITSQIHKIHLKYLIESLQ
jgi:hypothetical protein